MSIIRLAVQAHLGQSHLTIRELLAAAYYKRYEKPMPENSLDEDVKKWEAGCNDIPYLYDILIGH